MFTVALTRRYFRELPLHRVLVPSLDGPTLCFPWRLEAQSEVWRAELGELRDSYASAQSAAAREHKLGKVSRATLKRLSDDANRARRVHLVRVAAAEGYTWPGSGGSYVVEFAE